MEIGADKLEPDIFHRIDYLIQKGLETLDREVFHVDLAAHQVVSDALFSLNQESPSRQ